MTRYEEILLQLYEILKSYAKDGQSLSEDTELLSDLGRVPWRDPGCAARAGREHRYARWLGCAPR